MTGDAVQIAVPFTGVATTLVYFVVVSVWLNRDERRSTNTVQTLPPDGLSPAVLRCVRRLGYDFLAFAAAVISLATKGYLHIEQTGDGLVLTRIAGASAAELAPDERELAGALFKFGDRIELVQTNRARIAASIDVHRAALRKLCEPAYFRANRGFLIGGICILATTLVGTAAVNANPRAAIGYLIWITLVPLALVALYRYVRSSARGMIAARQGQRRPREDVWFAGVCLAVFGLVCLTVFGDALELFPISVVIVLALTAPTLALFAQLLKTPTEAGATLRRQAEALRVSLDAVADAAVPTPDSRLAYGVALDCAFAGDNPLARDLAAAVRPRYRFASPFIYRQQKYQVMTPAEAGERIKAAVENRS